MAGIEVGSYIVVRATNAGCFAGTLKSKDGDTTVLTNVRRLWYWSGAASLSELAQRGTSNPSACKFPIAVDEQEILGTIERIATTEEAQSSIQGVPVWTK
jgi:hypothetical protein